MRLESPYPAHHARCRLGSTHLEPGQIAGILDGDGAFTLLRRRSGSGVRIRPQIALVMRDDDPTPLAVWTTLRARRGAPLGTLIHSNTQRRHEWRVDRLDDVVELSEWLCRYPLLSPRGYRQLAAVREVALILLESRSPGGGMRRLPPADAVRLQELRDTIPARNSAAIPLPPAPTVAATAPDHRGWVLGGLLVADGCFAMRNARSRYAPTMTLTQRIDNLALLEGFRDHLGIGVIRIRPARGGRAPIAVWEVTRLDECAQLVAYLRAYPLPVCSPKAPQLDLLAASLDARAHGGLRSVQANPGPAGLAALAAELRAAKRYAGPRLLCGCVPSDPSTTNVNPDP